MVVVNHLRCARPSPGRRRLRAVAQRVPLDLVGMDSRADRRRWARSATLDWPTFDGARYRFFFNPIRYTSLGLAVVEAMMIGMPIVGLATTELATVIRNGVNGFVDTDLDALVDCMQELLADAELARRLGAARARDGAGALRHRPLRRRLASDADTGSRLSSEWAAK